MESAGTRRPPYIRLMTPRVIMIAVNIEVAIPSESVIANPLIGPVPNPNSNTAAMRVVMFASAMVENAFA